MVHEGGGTVTTTPAVTRLAPPRLRSDVVDRPRLASPILEASGRTVIISGPAGSGKSTLMAQAHARTAGATWLSIDTADNDPAVLWSALAESIAQAVDGFGASFRGRLAVPGLDAVGTIVPAAINELVEAGVPLVVYLDDIHLLQNRDSVQSLEAFVHRRPAHVTVVIAGRRRPPFRLAGQRLGGELIDIDSGRLDMTPEEARELLDAVGLTVPEPDVRRLVDRTEGWVAGLRWAAMVIENELDIDKFLGSATALDSGLARYLVEEVLDRQTQAHREFMLETSILRHLSADLCDAVRGRTDSGLLLEQLERSNAMVIVTERLAAQYRYHHLAAEILQARFERERPTDVVERHRAAARWYGERGEASEAFRHALAAGDRIRAADILCGHWYGLTTSGRIETAVAQLDRFDDAEIRAYQPLALAAAFMLAIYGDEDRSQHYYRIAHEGRFDGPPPDGSASMESALAIVRASLSMDGVGAMLADGLLAHRLEQPDSPWRALIAIIVAVGHIWNDDPKGGMPYLQETLSSSDGQEALRAYALSELALAQLWSGDETTALDTARAACDLSDRAGLDGLFIAALANGAAARALLAHGNIAGARVHLDAAAKPMEHAQNGLPLDCMRTRLVLAESALQLQDESLCRTYLEDAALTRALIADTGALGRHLERLEARLESASKPGVGLSDRELELVPFLPTHLTNREIAAEVHLSVNTVKTHLQSIYRKLGVAKRADAVDRCQELGLL